jgi:hypothetical protein
VCIKHRVTVNESNELPRALSSQVKRSQLEADHSPSATVEGKNGGAIPALPHMLSWWGV